MIALGFDAAQIIFSAATGYSDERIAADSYLAAIELVYYLYTIGLSDSYFIDLAHSCHIGISFSYWYFVGFSYQSISLALLYLI